MIDNMKPDSRQIEAKLSVLIDKTDEKGILEIISELDREQVLGKCTVWLKLSARSGILRTWKIYAKNDVFCREYERRLSFCEARILEYYLNEFQMPDEEAELTLQYVRILGRLPLGVLENLTEPSAADEIDMTGEKTGQENDSEGNAEEGKTKETEGAESLITDAGSDCGGSAELTRVNKTKENPGRKKCHLSRQKKALTRSIGKKLRLLDIEELRVVDAYLRKQGITSKTQRGKKKRAKSAGGKKDR